MISRGAESVEPGVQSFVQRICGRLNVSAVILFGSRARGDWLESSDVDLLVVSADWEGVPHLTRLERLFAEWAQASRLGADLIGLTPEEYRRRAQELSIVGEIAREGIVVYAVPDWVRPVPR
ncbi:MAG TPA: nucleotidyltransferase domain-containing protein [Bacillota bacterium]|nr:nucleotidyltransferase domain-containing protein [Bacillota bacterium]